MEVLSQMEQTGRLDKDIRKRLEDCGADIRDNRTIGVFEVEDIITNYHVGKILDLRQELMGIIEQVRRK
jgi:hypothetical protein